MTRMRTGSGYGLGGLAATAFAAAALAGCGSEKTFTAEEFVDGINAEGVELRLGEPLLTDDESQELYAVELEPVSTLPGSEGGSGDIGGSLSVSEDEGGADQEMASCENAADLLCYRASNVVVVLEGGGIEAQQFAVAVQRLSED